MTTERRYTMNALHIKNTVLVVLAAAGSAIAQALGGWDVALKVLICVMLCLVWMAALLDQATGSDFARDAICMFFIANEGLSILENTAIMGVPDPAFIKNMLDAIRQASDQGKQNTEAHT